jgi:hypothetical protein
LKTLFKTTLLRENQLKYVVSGALKNISHAETQVLKFKGQQVIESQYFDIEYCWGSGGRTDQDLAMGARARCAAKGTRSRD